MMQFLFILFLAGLCGAQLGFDGDVSVRRPAALVNMPRITKLDVECSLDGMTVDIQFSTIFNGIIFSKGFWNSPGCRYVNANSGRSSYQFIVPMTSCGTQGRDVPEKLFHNTLVCQMDEFIQEIWDTAKMITCQWQNNIQKTITFTPYAVGMLEVERLTFDGDDVSMWMEIQRGEGPFAEPLTGIARIGEELTIAIFVNDGGSNFDVLVSNCYAYSSSDISSPFTSRVRLTDDNGCLLKPKLLGYFYRTRQTGNTGASTCAYSYMTAFKFPDKTDMHITCEVELCKGGCPGHCNAAQYPQNYVQSPNLRSNAIPSAVSLIQQETTTGPGGFSPLFNFRLNRDLAVEDLKEEATKQKRSANSYVQSTKLRISRNIQVLSKVDLGVMSE